MRSFFFVCALRRFIFLRGTAVELTHGGRTLPNPSEDRQAFEWPIWARIRT